jgi:predicted phage-related endonuclease
MKWNDDKTITITPPKRPKKITGTRFAAIMGLNKWTTPFNAWCAITRTYEEPFEDTIYTVAGKTIEPKQAEFMKKSYFMTNLITPTDVYGADYFQKTWGDFFKDSPIFGGMWDYLLVDKDGKPTTVLEMKTTKRSEDWVEDVPEYYALQAALYAYLLGVDDVIMVCSFLGDKDYENPDAYQCSTENTIVRPFKLSERYPELKKTIKKVEKWWKTHVEGGVSPKFDEKADADILKVLRDNNLSPDTDIAALVAEAEQLKKHIDEVKGTVADDEKRYKTITDMLKKEAISQFKEGDKTVTISGASFDWITSKTMKDPGYDMAKMQEDGIDIEKYHGTPEPQYRFTPKARKESA